MANRIKGITVEIGGDTKKLDKALSGTNKQISQTQRSLKDVERLLKLDPGNTELLEQKQRLLGESVEATTDKLNTLREAATSADEALARGKAYDAKYQPLKAEIENVSATLQGLQDQQAEMEASLASGKVSASQFDDYQRSVKETTDKLEALKKQQKDLQKEFSGAKMDQNQYDALQREIIETENALSDLEDQAKKSGSAMEKLETGAKKVSDGAGALADAFAPVSTAAAGLVAAAVATVPATEEMRSDLSKLGASAEAAGVGLETAQNVMREFTLVSDEMDSSVEATANLMQAGFTESNLQIAMENLAGAYLRFPDTLKIESLADGLQETLATGQATGQFGELLERLGFNLDTFNAGLEVASVQGDQYNYVLNQLAHQGLSDTYDAWKENNQALIESKESTLAFKDQMATFASEVVQPVTTKLMEMATQIASFFNALPEGAQTATLAILGILAVVSPVASAVGSLAGAVSKISGLGSTLSGVFSNVSSTASAAGTAVSTGFGGALKFIAAHPVVAIVAAIGALIAIFVTLMATNEEFREKVFAVWDGIKAKFAEFDEWLMGVFATDWTTKFGALGEVVNAVFHSLGSIWENVKGVFSGIIEFISGVFSGDWEKAWGGIVKAFEGVFGLLGEVAKLPMNAVLGVVNAILQSITNAINWVVDKINSIDIDIPDWIPGIGGKSINFNLDHVEAPQIPYLAQGTVTQPNNPFLAVVGDNQNEPEIVSPLSTITQAVREANRTSGGGGKLIANLYLDGKQFGRVAAPYIMGETNRIGVNLVKG